MNQSVTMENLYVPYFIDREILAVNNYESDDESDDGVISYVETGDETEYETDDDNQDWVHQICYSVKIVDDDDKFWDEPFKNTGIEDFDVNDLNFYIKKDDDIVNEHEKASNEVLKS